jgi:hypothetical protein
VGQGSAGGRVRAENLTRCRALLEVGQGSGAGGAAPPQEPPQSNQADKGTRTRCPVRGQGLLVIVGKLEPVRWAGPEAEAVEVEAADTS